MWGGHADAAKTKPWTEDTIVNVWSSTKTVTALAGLMLIDRGLIEPSTRVASVWPEFGANGKEHIEFRHFLSHSSGVSGWDQPVAPEDIFDWDKSTAMLAAQAPWWEPGTASGYQALNHGHLIGEVLRRLTGKTLKQFVADEIAGPLDADFQIGAAPGDSARIADVILPVDPMEGIPPFDQWTEQMIKTFTGPAPDPAIANTAGVARRRHRGGQRSHQCAGTGADPLGDLVGRHRRWRATACARRPSRRSSRCSARDRTWCWHMHPIKWGLGFGLPHAGDPFRTSPTRRSASGAAGAARGRR